MADPAYPPAQDPAYPPAQDPAYPPAKDPAYPPAQGGAPPYPASDQPPAYPPQQAPPQQQATATTVVVQQQPVQQAVIFRDVPVVITDSRGQQVTTQLEYRSGAMTWVAVLVLIVLGFWCCACIPLCIDGVKDVYHISPTDGTVVGVYKRL